MRIHQVTAVGETEYEVSFEGDVDPATIRCTVDLSGSVPGVGPKPDVFVTGNYGEPRPVVAAVIAVHRARQVE